MTTNDPLPTSSPTTSASASASPSPSAAASPLSDRSGSGVTDAVRAQILATEHWSLLATRSMTWNEVFSRAGMFITVLSAAVVALALVAQATAFGPGFRLFALLVLPVVLLVGLATILRLGAANADDFWMVSGMNRLRHAYLELAPELEPYFVTAYHDDTASIQQSYGLGFRPGFGRILSATPNLVAAITAVVAGVLAALLAQLLGVPDGAAVIIGIVAALGAIVGHVTFVFHAIRGVQRAIHPRFPA
jgi:hypothetical protein